MTAATARDKPSQLASVLADCVRRLRDGGIPEPARDARQLVAAAGSIDHRAFLMQPDLPLTPDQLAAIGDAMARRLRHEPVSRIVGLREFYGRSFKISPAVLDPRPDSEVLVDLAIDCLGDSAAHRPAHILDIGTGSGCLLLTLLAECPLARGIGLDISEAACRVAQENAERLGLSDRADIVTCDALSYFGRSFDLLVSNPPYIASADIPDLDVDVRAFDPHLALDGGRDGLDIYRALAPRLLELVPNGWCVFEVGAGMAPAVQDLLAQALGGSRVAAWRQADDLLGHTRCVAVKTRR